MPFEKDIHRTKNPFEIFILLLAMFSAVPLAIGVRPAPESLESQLGGYAQVWGICLALGSLLALIGVFWKRPRHAHRFSVTGLVLEQTGMVAVAGATIYYASCALIIIGVSALAPAGIIFAFGIACGYHAWRIKKFMEGLK